MNVFPKARRKAFAPAGITYGATVTGYGLEPKSWKRGPIAGQVWSQADSTIQTSRRARGFWWVVAEDGTAYHCDERELTLVAQITGDDERLELTA